MTGWHLAKGYRFAGVSCGIRPNSDRLDLALVISDRPATAAGVFTQNRVVAAPVQLCRQRVPLRLMRGIVICSGNANACTGAQGLEDASQMACLTAEGIGCKPDQILVCSTGVIGVHLPMTKVESGIRQAAKQLDPSPQTFEKAATAILTTDTRIKVSTRNLQTSKGNITITGFAKGAAMIGPNMATMLGFVLTDASVSANDLNQIARVAAAKSFNCISVEGHTSTNDTLLLLANGPGPNLEGEELKSFEEGVTSVCADLAREIASDAEGASHLIQIEVEGTRSDGEAYRIAKTIADSALVKTAIFGADPNWGRIVSAAGYAGVEFAEGDLSLWLGDTLLYREGTPQSFDKAGLSSYMKQNRELTMRLKFTLGQGRCTFWTCDLTCDYVRLNADYTT